MKAIVLAAGEGSRMRPLTYTRPKVLVPVGGEPMLNHVARGLRAAGATEMLLVVQYREEEVRAWAHSARFEGLAIEVLRQPETPYGTGAAALAGRAWTAGAPFMLHFGDILCGPENYPRFGELARANPHETILTVYRTGAVGGGAVFVEGGRATRIVEKPTPEQSVGACVNAGVFLFQPDAFEVLDRCGLSKRGELELTDVFTRQIADGRPPLACELTGFWSNVSDAAEVLRLNRVYGVGGEQGVVLGAGCSVGVSVTLSDAMLLDRAEIGPGVTATHLVLGEGAQIGGGSSVEGRPSQPAVLADGVTVAGGCRLGGARIGPGVTVGAGCFVGDGAVLRDCTVGAGVTIGGGAEIEHAEIGSGSSIGPGYRLTGTADNRVRVAAGSHWE